MPTDDMAAALAALQPSDDYTEAVWDAKELLTGRCTADAGFEYRPRPNGVTLQRTNRNTQQAWAEWEAWLNDQIAAKAGFEQTFLGADEQAGGCQLDASRQVHGTGPAAYSKLNDLHNEMLAVLPQQTDRTAANVRGWVNAHQAEIDQLHHELAEELNAARQVLEGR